MYQKQKTDSMRTWQTYLFEKIEVYTVSLFLSDKEITLFKSSRDSCNIHGDRHLGFNYFVVLSKEQNDVTLCSNAVKNPNLLFSFVLAFAARTRFFSKNLFEPVRRPSFLKKFCHQTYDIFVND